MLRELQADPKIGDTIAEVRGLGLMVGVEFKSPTDPYTPAQGKVPAKMASRVQNKCLEKDLLTLTTSVYETMRSVLAPVGFISRFDKKIGTDDPAPLDLHRFIPPLNISKEDMAKACQIIKEAISEVVHEG
jgi:4-aminobutyrate aminotransferase